MASPRGNGVERPGELLARVGLELNFEDGAEHRLVLVVDEVDEQHDGVGVVLDRDELMERGFGEPCLGERRNLDVQEIAKQASRKRRPIPDQRDHTLMIQRGRHVDVHHSYHDA